MQAHHPCMQPQCLARKFVVFGSVIDLKGHTVEEHGADMSARDRKDAMRLQAEFEFEEVGVGGRRGRRERGDREREREPPPSAVPGRPGAAGARRRDAFGGNLTAESNTRPGSSSVQASQQPSRRQSPSPDPVDAGPVLPEWVLKLLFTMSGDLIFFFSLQTECCFHRSSDGSGI